MNNGIADYTVVRLGNYYRTIICILRRMRMELQKRGANIREKDCRFDKDNEAVENSKRCYQCDERSGGYGLLMPNFRPYSCEYFLCYNRGTAV